MFKKFASLALVAALICSLVSAPAFAQNKPSSDAKSIDVKSITATDSPDAKSVGEKEAQPGGSLKADIQKLVADAKAGKGMSIPDPQNQPKQSNSLSKTAKIAIAVGIGVAIILTIIAVHAKDNFFD